MPRLRTLLAALLLAATVLPLQGLAGPARAVEPDEILTDAGLEARARHLSTQLRCLVCQNQSIDDSNAPLARDLRLLVRERLKAGDTDTQVLAYIVARYGQFVLLRPPLSPATALLWLAPLLFLGAIGLLVVRRIGRLDAVRAGPTAALSSDEQRQLDAILARDTPQTGAAKPAD